MESIFCQNCGINPASLWVTKISNDRVSKLCICTECFSKLSSQSSPFAMALPLNFLNLVPSTPEGLKPSKAYEFKVCKNCSTSWSDFLQTGLLGCNECYRSFYEYLRPILEDIHSSLAYKGKIPKRLPESVRIKGSLRRLKTKLFASIDEENYEEAARIRDVINNLKKELSHVSQNAKK